MDQTVIKRVKRLWSIVWLGVTGFALVVWGFQAAIVAAMLYLAMNFLAVIAFILYVLLGEAPVAGRILVIALLFVGLFVEVGAMLVAVRWLLSGKTE